MYDSNKPHSFGDTGHTDPRTDIVSFDLSSSALRATSPSDQAGSTLAGFFCTNYAPVTPNAALATSFGEFLTFQFDPRSWMWVYGSLLPMTGGTGSEMSTQTVLPRTLPHPRDNALLRESSSAPVFLYQGGAPFWVPDPTQLSHFGGWSAVCTVPDGTLPAFLGAPADDTLIREFSSAKVFRITLGVPVPATTAAAADIRTVPDGAISAMLLDKIAFSVPRLTVGRSATGTIALKSPWPDADLKVKLDCTPGGFVTVPATVTIPKNSLSANFPITTSTIVLPSSPLPLQFGATLQTAMIAAMLPLQIPRITTMSVCPPVNTAGGSAIGTVSIEIPYAADLTLTVRSSSPTFATAPANVTIPKGATSVQFTVNSPASTAVFPTMSVTIYASVQDASASVTIQVKPSVVLGTLQSLVLSPASVHAGGTATGIVTLENAVVSTLIG